MVKKVTLPDSSYLRLAKVYKRSQAWAAADPRFIFDFGGDVIGSDQFSNWIAAYDGETKEGLGYIQYSMWQDINQIDMIEVREEKRGQGIGEALVEAFLRKEELDYNDVSWGMTTESGTALKDKMDQKLGV
jgi:GNAT superfamily N-acetyltransferase